MKPYIVRKSKTPKPVEPPSSDSIFSAENRGVFEEWLFKRASYFTVVRKVSSRPVRWASERYESLPAAMRDARDDPRALVYAVSEQDYNLSALLPRNRWKELLTEWLRNKKP